VLFKCNLTVNLLTHFYDIIFFYNVNANAIFLNIQNITVTPLLPNELLKVI